MDKSKVTICASCGTEMSRGADLYPDWHAPDSVTCKAFQLENIKAFLRGDPGDLECIPVCETAVHIVEMLMENEDLKTTLDLIQSMAGHPDAAEGCRNVIKLAAETLEKCHATTGRRTEVPKTL